MLVAIEQFAADEVRADPGMGVLLLSDRPTTDAQAFFVLEGELTFRLGADEHRVERETWMFVPPAAAYTLAVTGDEPARFLHIHVPGASSQEAVVRRAGGSEGEKITDRPEHRATLLVDADELTITEFDYGPGQRGARLHVHREHADGFFVVEGEFTFHLRDGSRVLPAGTLIVLPPGVVHGFDNDSEAHSRCFNFHMPSFGFADYMRGRNPAFDQHDPPEDGGASPELAVVVRLSD